MNNRILETPTISRGRFDPTHVELINILRNRIDRGERSSLITDNHILYETEPWLFQHIRHVSFCENEWYYFVTRKQPVVVTRKVDSWRPCRKVGGSGRWKTGGLTKVVDERGVRVGSMQNASFQTNGKTQKDGKMTGWVMREFVLDRPGFQELVLCRIKFNPDNNNAQYAPRITSIVIGQLLVETHQDPYTEHQGIVGQDSNYPLWNEGMVQNQNLGSYDHMKQYGQGSGDLVDNPIQYLVQETMERLQVPMMMNQALNEEQAWNEYSGPSLAHQYFGQDMVPMTQHQHFSVDEHQGLGSFVKFFGESSGLQQNHIRGTQATYHSIMEEEQHQDFGSSALFLAQNNQSLRQNLSRISPMEQQLWQTNYSHVPVMVNQAFEEQQHVPWSAQPYAQYNGQNNTLPTVPMTTQQQQDNAVRNLPAQLQLEEQDNVPLMNQALEDEAAYLPMNQGVYEPYRGIVGYL